MVVAVVSFIELIQRSRAIVVRLSGWSAADFSSDVGPSFTVLAAFNPAAKDMARSWHCLCTKKHSHVVTATKENHSVSFLVITAVSRRAATSLHILS